MTYEKPKQRPGFRASWVRWDRDGRVREVHYTRIDRAAERRAAEDAKARDHEPAPRRRGVMAVEQQRDLFGTH